MNKKKIETELKEIFHKSTPAINELICYYQETSMAHFYDSPPVYWRELIQWMSIANNLFNPTLEEALHPLRQTRSVAFQTDRGTHAKSYITEYVLGVGLVALTFSEAIRDNKYVLMYSTEQNSYHLLWASERLKNDPGIVTFAVSCKSHLRRDGRSGQSIRYAGAELRSSPKYADIAMLAIENTVLAEYFIQLERIYPRHIDDRFKEMQSHIDSRDNKKALETTILLFSLMTRYAEHLYMRHENALSSLEEKRNLREAYAAMTMTMSEKWPKDPAFDNLLLNNKQFNTARTVLQDIHDKWKAATAHSKSVRSTTAAAPESSPAGTEDGAPLATIAKSAPTSDPKGNCSDIKACISADAAPTHSPSPSSAAQAESLIYKKSRPGFNIEGLKNLVSHYSEVSQRIFVTLETRNLAHKKLIVATALLYCDQEADLQYVFSKAMRAVNSTPLRTDAELFTMADFFDDDTQKFFKPEDLGITLLVDDSKSTQATTQSSFWDLFKSKGIGGQNTGGTHRSGPGCEKK